MAGFLFGSGIVSPSSSFLDVVLSFGSGFAVAARYTSTATMEATTSAMGIASIGSSPFFFFAERGGGGGTSAIELRIGGPPVEASTAGGGGRGREGPGSETR